MGAVKRMLTDREEDLRLELGEIAELIHDSIDRGETAEERSTLYARQEEVEKELRSLPTIGVDFS
jgi:hypothetical protein